MVESISFVIPFANRLTDTFRLSLESLKRQTDQNYEVILIDVKSDEEYSKPMVSLCEEYGVKYHRIELPYTHYQLEVQLWNLCINYGFRQATGDLVIYGGMDRIYESNTIENIKNAYNYYSRDGHEVLLAAHVWDIQRTPDVSELDDFEKLLSEARWRGGYGYLGSSRKWLYKVWGLDESSRWLSDLDLVKRGTIDNAYIIWNSHGRSLNRTGLKPNRMVHMANHIKTRQKYRTKDAKKVARRSRLIFHNERSIIRNTPEWGTLSEEHIRGILNIE